MPASPPRQGWRRVSVGRRGLALGLCLCRRIHAGQLSGTARHAYPTPRGLRWRHPVARLPCRMRPCGPRGPCCHPTSSHPPPGRGAPGVSLPETCRLARAGDCVPTGAASRGAKLGTVRQRLDSTLVCAVEQCRGLQAGARHRAAWRRGPGTIRFQAVQDSPWPMARRRPARLRAVKPSPRCRSRP